MRLVAKLLLPFLATSPTWLIGPFERPPHAQPVIRPQPASLFTEPNGNKPVAWQALHTFNPAAIVKNNKIYVLYRAEDNSGSMQIGMHTSRLGLAESTDGLHFTTHAQPVFYPTDDAQHDREWPGGVEDPRIVESPDGTYVLTYTQWNRKTYTVGIATSKDLLTWTKHGPALGTEGKYAHLAYKSAGILTRLQNNKLIAARINGSYWMYWGEITIRLARSNDLIHWQPVEGANGEPVPILAVRPNHFDSAFPEVGPPPVLTKDGIVLLYNAKNASDKTRDPSLAPATYSVGEALFSAQDPTHLLSRTNQPVFQPELPFEKTGQYQAGTTFAEGLVLFHNQWFLYYGTADSFVGVAYAKFNTMGAN